MMDCEHAAELISAQLDGELTPAETAMLEAHLEQCPPCRALRRDFQALHQVLLESAAQWQAEPPADLTRRVLERVRETKTVPFRAQKNRWKQLASLAAVLALVVIGGGAFVLGQGGASGGRASGGGAAGGDNGTGVALAIAPRGSDGPTADCAIAPVSGETMPESTAEGDGISAHSGEIQSRLTSSADLPQAADAPEETNPSEGNASLLEQYGLEGGIISGNEAWPQYQGEGSVEMKAPGEAIDIQTCGSMTVLINGVSYCAAEEASDGSENLEDLTTVLHEGYMVLGQLSPAPEETASVQLQADFSGIVYANAEEPDHVYVYVSTSQFTGVQRFDRLTTEGE